MRKLLIWGVALLFLGSACADESPGVAPSDSGPSTSAGGSARTDGDGGRENAAPSDPATPPLLYTSGDIPVPDGTPGELSIAMVGQPQGVVVPVVVQNDTGQTVTEIEVAGTARDAGGTIIGSGSSLSVVPVALQPGEWGFASVYFGGDELPGDADLDLVVTGSAPSPDGIYRPVDVAVTEAAHNAGEFSEAVSGIVTNDGATDLELVSVSVACFDGGEITGVHDGYTDLDTIPAGSTGSFTVNIFDVTCSSWAAGASGRTTG